MQTMDSSLARLVKGGKITLALAQERAHDPEELNRLLRTADGTVPMAPSGMAPNGMSVKGYENG